MVKDNHTPPTEPEVEKNEHLEVVQKAPASPAEDPDQMFGILSLAFAFFFPIVGLVLGIIAYNKSKKDGYKNTLALVGIITNGIFVVLTVIFIALIVALFVFAGAFSASDRNTPGNERPGYRYDEKTYRSSEPTQSL